MHPTHVPLRVATGAFILNSGISKLGADEGTAQYLHSAAAGTYPALFKDMQPKNFAKLLSYSEIGVGAALLAPMVSATVAGAALTGFGASLVGMYLKTPSMTLDDGIRPSPDGIAVAKDSWLVGAGLTLMTQGLIGTVKSEAKALKKGVKSEAKALKQGMKSEAKAMKKGMKSEPKALKKGAKKSRAKTKALKKSAKKSSPFS